jgi:hypothetical protein
MLWIASASPDLRSPDFRTYNLPYIPYYPSTKTHVLEPIRTPLPFVANSGFPTALRFPNLIILQFQSS